MPDRIPVDFNGHSSSGISVQAYCKLRKHLGIKESKLFIYDVIQQLAVVEEDMLDLFRVDVAQLGCEYAKKNDYWKDWQLHDGTPCKIPKHTDITVNNEGDYEIVSKTGKRIGIQKRGCLYFEQTHFPLMENDDREFDDISKYFDEYMWGKISKPPFPAGYDDQGLKIRRQDAMELRKSTDRAIYSNFGAKLFEPSTQLFRMDNLLMELLLDPDRMHLFYDKLLAFHMENIKRYLKETGEYIDILGIAGDDLGMQTGPMISEEMFCAFLKPRYAKMIQFVKTNYPHIKICMHCCGGIYPLIPHLIEIGFDAINPVQISCRDMQPEKLKKEYGRDITFWGGGCDTGSILSNADPQAIKKHVRHNIEIFQKNGGFVFQQVHNILANVPPQNIVAMFEAVDQFR